MSAPYRGIWEFSDDNLLEFLGNTTEENTYKYECKNTFYIQTYNEIYCERKKVIIKYEDKRIEGFPIYLLPLLIPIMKSEENKKIVKDYLELFDTFVKKQPIYQKKQETMEVENDIPFI